MTRVSHGGKLPGKNSPAHNVGRNNNKGGGKGGNKGNKGGGKKHGGGNRYGGFGGYKGVKTGRARRLVNAELNPLIRALTGQMGDVNRLFARTRGDLDHIYKESGDFIGHQNQLMGQTFDQAGAQQQAAQAALMSQLQTQGNANAGSASDELARLGLGNPAFLQQLANDQQNAMMQAGQVGANNQANLSLQRSGMESVGNLLGSMNVGSRSSALGQAVNARNESLYDLRNQKNELRAQRPELMLKMLEQMAAQGWGQYVDQRNLGMQQQQINMQRRQQAQSNAQYNAGQAQQNAYNSTLSSLYQQQLGNTYR